MDTTDNKDLCEDRTPSEVIERVNALPLSWHNKIALVSSLVRDNMQMDEFGFAAELVEAARGLTEEREASMSPKFAVPYGGAPLVSDPEDQEELHNWLSADFNLRSKLITMTTDLAMQRMTEEWWEGGEQEFHEIIPGWVVELYRENCTNEFTIVNLMPTDEEGPMYDEQVRVARFRHEAPKDPWASDPDYPREDWQEEASEGSTQLGYWDWVSHQREADA